MWDHPGWLFLMVLVTGYAIVHAIRALRGEHCPGCNCDGRRNFRDEDVYQKANVKG